jgi:nitrogenase molybdenum-cofactor synthesis protein NifE
MSRLQGLDELAELVLAIEADLIEIRESLDMHQFCAYWGAHDVLRYLRDCTCVVHGTSGCMTSRRLLPTLGSAESCDLDPHYSTALDEHDVIFGGEKKLAAALREVEARHAPALVAVVTNCCADIIGDDIAGVVASVPEVASKTIWLHTGGFTGKSYRAGAEAAFVALARLMADAPARPVRKRTVNLFLRRWIWGATLESEISETVRLLQKMGVSVHRVMRQGMSVDEFLSLREAEANVSLCSFFASALFDEMERRLATKSVRTSSPVGLSQTLSWMEAIASALALPKRPEDDEEVNDLLGRRQRLRDRIGEGRHAVVWTQTGDRMIGLARLAQDVGLEPVLVGVDPAAVRDKITMFRREIDSGFRASISTAASVEAIRELLHELNDPIVFCNDDFFPEHPVFEHRHAQNVVYGLSGARLLYSRLDQALQAKRSRYSLVTQVVPR